MLPELFGLTWAEAAVAIGITSISTVRAQIRQILIKTQSNSLRDLVCLILRLI